MLNNNNEITDKFIEDSPFANKGFYNFDSNSQLPRHRWYYFKEGFSKDLVAEAINSVTPPKNNPLMILDPFCGCGTTPLTSALLGQKCIGIEVNPFLAFVSKVKSEPRKWKRKQFFSNLEEIIRISSEDQHSTLEEFSTFTQKEGVNKWLFNLEVLRKFTSINYAIDKVSPNHRDAFVLAAIVSAFDCSNVKRDGKGLRYKKNWKEMSYTGINLENQFRNHLSEIFEDVEISPIDSEDKPKIINSDSRISVSSLDDNSVDLVVTSPPYLNSFDYSDVYRPELFLGGYVKNNSELTNIRLQTIRSHVQVNWPKDVSIECDLLKPYIEKLSGVENLWNKRIPLMVQAYFDDLSSVLSTLSKKVKTNGQIWMVVSTSSYGGIHIPVDLILGEIATNAGFMLEAIHRLRNLRTSGQQWKQLKTKTPPLRESLIILSKPI